MQRNNRSIFKPKAKGSYKIENKNEESTVYIYDEISWWGIQAEQFVKDFNAITSNTIHLRFNTPGGSVFDGMAIYNAIKQHKSKTIAHVDGLAASIASVILMACDEVRISDGGFVMIHDPWSIVAGSAEDMRKEADLLDKVTDTIVAAYMGKCKKTKNELQEMMAEETWMNSSESIEFGFCDTKDSDSDEKKNKSTTILFDLSAFGNVPDSLKEQKPKLSARDIEHILCDAGCSKQQAKSIVAEGYKEKAGENQRDVDNPVPQNAASSAEDQRDVDASAPTPVINKKDRTADLVIKAAMVMEARAAA